MGILLHNNRVSISGNIIYFLTCFVRIPLRNSVNPIIQTTSFPALIMLRAPLLHITTHFCLLSVDGREHGSAEDPRSISGLTEIPYKRGLYPAIITSILKLLTLYGNKWGQCLPLPHAVTLTPYITVKMASKEPIKCFFVAPRN